MTNTEGLGAQSVNDRFDATKLAQINAVQDKAAELARRVAAGELKDNGGGTYMVLTGWDRGEVIRYDTNADAILGDHGLDTTASGSVALYSRQREWFGLGQIVPDGLDSIDEVLELIGGPLEYRKESAYYRDPMTGDFRQIPDTFASVWMDQDGMSGAMGTVGKVYRHAQDAKAAEFLFDLIGEKVVFESVGRMQNNAKFFAGLHLRDDMIIDPAGIADPIRQYLYLINTHDGTGKLNVIVTPWRIRCKNTERFAVGGASASWGVRHTMNWDSSARQAEARTALGLTERYYSNWQAEETELLGCKLTGAAIDKFWAVVEGLDGGAWEAPETPTGRAATIYRNRRDRLEFRLAESMTELGRNAYAAERAVTAYLDHDQTRRTSSTWGKVGVDYARKGIALLGNDDERKAHLHSGLLALARG